MTAIFILFPVLAVLIGAVIFFQRGAIKNLLSRSLQLRVLLIRLPQNFETKKDFNHRGCGLHRKQSFAGTCRCGVGDAHH